MLVPKPHGVALDGTLKLNATTIYLFKQPIIHSKQNKDCLSSRSAAKTIGTGRPCPASYTPPCLGSLSHRWRPPLSGSSPLLPRNVAEASSSNQGSHCRPLPLTSVNQQGPGFSVRSRDPANRATTNGHQPATQNTCQFLGVLINQIHRSIKWRS